MNIVLSVERTEPLAPSRLAQAKRGFASRRIILPDEPRLIVGEVFPRVGDLLLARVETLGHHTKLELPTGRRAALHRGDLVLVVFANRYAPDQFEAEVPDDLGPCDLVAAGGTAGQVLRRADRTRRPTRLLPLGLVADSKGHRLSTRDFALPPATPPLCEAPGQRPRVIAVLGSSMNAGKTTAVAAMARGEMQSGHRVGVAKITGTGAGGDLWSYLDAGAQIALDFTDAGWPSTHRIGAGELESAFETLTATLIRSEIDVAIVEISDGLLFEETAAIVRSPAFRRVVEGVVFAAADGMGALAGEASINRMGLPLLALTGQFTRAPLTLEEVMGSASAPVLTVADMQNGTWLASDALARMRSNVA